MSVLIQLYEPILFRFPVSLLFLYFVIYSVLGWCQETIYCSLKERQFVPRGFLHGPLCPIYGVGVIMMICWFEPLMDRPMLFYLTAVVCMSAWEYFVGWFLETTTHIKYWDYSDTKYNLKGRICLWVSLTWGVCSYVVLYFIHPRIAAVVEQIPVVVRYVVDGFALGVITADAIATIYELAKTSEMLAKVQQAGEELRFQASLDRAELSTKFQEAREALSDRLEELRPEQLDERGRRLKEHYDELLARAEFTSRRFRASYRGMKTSDRNSSEALESVKRRGERIRRHVQERRAERKKA